MIEIKNNPAIDLNEIDFLLTIGNFDGVHLGHKKLLEDCKKKCDKEKLKLVLATFNPHPRKILGVFKNHYKITSDEEKKKIFSDLGIDFYWEIPFTRDLSNQSPDKFINDYLVTSKNLKVLFLGHDFSFGSNKSGGFDFIKSYCKQFNIEVLQGEIFRFNDQIVSSTKIRTDTERGDFESVNGMLGRPFALNGIVVRGAGRGKILGFPTANVAIDPDQLIPGIGVYVTKTKYKGMYYESMTNVGHNPTFNSGMAVTIESNLFDFNQDIYGEEVSIQFLKKIRDEKKFSSVNLLIDQIASDKREVKKYYDSK